MAVTTATTISTPLCRSPWVNNNCDPRFLGKRRGFFGGFIMKTMFLVISHYYDEANSPFNRVFVYGAYTTFEQAKAAADMLFAENTEVEENEHDTVPYTLDDDETFCNALYIVGEQARSGYNVYNNYCAVVPSLCVEQK